MLPATTLQAAEALLGRLRAAGLTIATAESCTGGLVAAALTAIPGSSDVVSGGFVTYSNTMKTRLLGVPEEILQQAGAVSEACAAAMVAGALRGSQAGLALAVTGIAGPGGGSAEKPVGLVYIAGARAGAAPQVRRFVFGGDRTAVRAATVAAALALAVELVPEI